MTTGVVLRRLGLGALGLLLAAAAASLATRRVQGEIAVHLPGGRLKIEWQGPGHPILMTGPATEVFRGEYITAERG